MINWQFTILGNQLTDYVWTASIFLVSLAILYVFNRYLIYRLKILAVKSATNLDDTAVEVLENIRPPFYFFLALYISLIPLTLTELTKHIIFVVLIAIVVYQVTIALQIIINHFVKNRFEDKEDKTAAQAARLLGNILKAIIWIIAFLFALQNFGINVTSLIAGLGVGGIAVAFALQNILADLFSSFAIYFDRPFSIGDFIVTGKHSGTVQKIGLKTTRIRALQGEEIVISNKDLTNQRIQNFKKLKKRRVAFNIGITYDTNPEKLEQIPELIKNIIEKIPLAEFGRVHLNKLGNSALNFEIIYHVNNDDYDTYMDINQRIMLELVKTLAEHKITFAYPTQTIYVNK